MWRQGKAGVVLAGDWLERIGTRVRLGDQIFETAPIDNLRAIIQIGEADIDQVQVGGIGELATRGQPDRVVAFRVTQVVPVGEALEGQNVFEVRAEFDGRIWRDHDNFEPGDVVRHQGKRYIAVGASGPATDRGQVPPDADMTQAAWAHADWMKPGMAGIARIDADQRSVIWIATHKLVDFLRLKLWM